MKQPFSLFLARRYLRPKRSPVSLITLICVMGVALGVWIMLVVIAVMVGFSERAKELLLGFEPHVFLEMHVGSESPAYPFGMSPTLAENLRHQPGVSAVQPIVEGMVLLDANSRRIALRMRAFPTEDPVIKTQTKLKEGTLDLVGDSAVIADDIAQSLGIGIGDSVTVYSQGHLDKVLEAFQDAERDPITPQEAAQISAELAKVDTAIRSHKAPEGIVQVPRSLVSELVDTLEKIQMGRELRPADSKVIEAALGFIRDEVVPPTGPLQSFSKSHMQDVFQSLDALTTQPQNKNQEGALAQIKELVLPKELIIKGIFTNAPTPSSPSIFVPLHVGQELYSLDNSVHTVAVRSQDAYKAKELAENLQHMLDEKENVKPGDPMWVPDLDFQRRLVAVPWMERQDLKQYFYALANERRMMYFALFMIMVVAAFCIMVTMITITVEKAKEIGVMKALGARESQIVAVFLLQGMLVGAFGALCGLGFAGLTLRFRDQIQAALGAIGMDPFPAETYGLERIPALLTLNDIGMICGGAFVLCSLAALPPAWMVARLDPAKALRKE